ncbi:MAG: hypothetical protein U5R31_15165 [Acidimicrobiia bacterium]|nr:hypothetical protein [Acidimicrobiia bacterium]
MFDRDGVVAVTESYVVIVNDREWQPDVVHFRVGPGLTVRGWQDERTATLFFEEDGEQVIIEHIADPVIARETAEFLRRSPGAGGTPRAVLITDRPVVGFGGSDPGRCWQHC